VKALKNNKKINFKWLKFMYIWNIVISGGGGLGIIFLPNLTKWLFNAPTPKITYGIIGSVFLSFAIISILGLKNPIKFAPILLFQLTYKIIWVIGIIIPMIIAGEFYIGALPAVIIYAFYIIGDFIAIPFSNILKVDK
jgi:hypothetical protein